MEAFQVIPLIQRNAKRVTAEVPGAQKLYGDWYVLNPGALEIIVDEVAQLCTELEQQQIDEMSGC